MMSSKTLKMFVKAHEQKLNAKISGLSAGQHDPYIQDRHAGTSQFAHSTASNHWNMRESDMSTRRRPKSRYFDFILTTTHQ
jgi:hypothetical protein